MTYNSNSSIHVVPGGESNYGPPFGADFIPNLQYIENITQAWQAVVTFTTTTNFTVGEWISFRIPPSNGMIQLNNQTGLIIAINANVVTINVNTLGFWPFVSMADPQYPCIAVPATSGIPPGSGYVTLEDAFDNRPLI
jgi:hypothetical protein